MLPSWIHNVPKPPHHPQKITGWLTEHQTLHLNLKVLFLIESCQSSQQPIEYLGTHLKKVHLKQIEI